MMCIVAVMLLEERESIIVLDSSGAFARARHA